MAVRAFLSTILTTAISRGWLSERAAENVASLVDHGLHPEQALVGTKLLTLDQYAELLSEASGLPYVQLPAESVQELNEPELDEHIKATKTIPLIGGQNEIWLGHAEPHKHHLEALNDKLQKRKINAQSYVISHADWKRQQSSPRKPSSALRDLFNQAEQKHRRHLTLHEEAHATRVTWTRSPHATGELWPATLLAEAVALFRRHQEYRGWILEDHHHGGHRCLHLQRVTHQSRADHPTDWSQALNQFLREPKGVLVIEAADPYLMRKLTHRFVHDEDEVDDDEPLMQRIEHEDDREAAIHESLLGRPLIILDQVDPWKRRLAESGIPLVSVSPSRHPEGIAWCIVRHD